MMQANRILHVPRRFVAEEWGGTETVILEIAKYQQRAMWRPEVFTSLALSCKKVEMIGGISVQRFQYCYPFFGLSTAEKQMMDKKGGNLISLSLLHALLRAKDVRLFHSHALKRLGGEVLTASRICKKACVVTLHGGVFDVPPAELELMMQPMVGKWEWGKLFGALLRSRQLLEEADHVICVGESEYEQAKKNIAHERISYLPNGVDSLKFEKGDALSFRRRHGIPETAFVVMNISRIDAQKNQLILVEAFERFLKRQPDSFLILIGPETQIDYSNKLKTYIRNQNLNHAIKILPGLRNDDPELVNAYHACNLFVLPSMHEPFGIVVLEAWSCQRPVLVSRVGGLRSLVREGETGFFFDSNSRTAIDDLANRLGELAMDPELLHAIGKAGCDEVKVQYSWDIIGERLEAIYQQAEERNYQRLKK